MTTCYTFKVEMTVQVLHDGNADEARSQLDANGGFVSKRDVELVDFTVIGGTEE